MEYIYATMLLHKAGKKLNDANLEKVLSAAGVKVDKARIPPLHHHHARPHQHATPAPSHATPQLRARPLNRFHAVERPLRRHRFPFPNRRGTVRIHGACVPEGRSAVFVESRDGYQGWRGGSI